MTGVYNVGGSGSGLLKNPNVAQANSLDCLDDPFVQSTTPYTIGQHESVKLGLIGTLGTEGVTRIGQGVLTRDQDHEAENGNQYGFSARYYAEELGGTEFDSTSKTITAVCRSSPRTYG